MQDAPQTWQQSEAQPASGQAPMKPHRGGTILALGIIGIVLCFITGIIAWVMGNNDLKEIKQGLRDPEGESLTKAGMICGIIGTVLAVLGIIWAVFVVGMTSILGGFGY